MQAVWTVSKLQEQTLLYGLLKEASGSDADKYRVKTLDHIRTGEASTMSRQQDWALRKKKQGNCCHCGMPRTGKSTSLCTACLVKNRLRARAIYQCKPRVGQGRGRPQLCPDNLK